MRTPTPKTSLILTAAALAVTLLCVQPARAAFTSFEDFEGLSTGHLYGQNGWDTTPDDTGNVLVVATDGNTNQAVRYSGLSAGGQDRGFSKGLGALSIANNTTATMFLRVMADGSTQNSQFGLSDNAAPLGSDFNNFEVQMYIFNDAGSIGLGARNAASTLADLTADTWYNLWAVIDQSADTYDVYLQGGAFTTQTLVASHLAFRNGTTGSLQTFYGLTNADPASNHTFLDDIQFAPGADLSNPLAIPTPAALPAGLGLLALGALRRRRA